VNAGAEIDPLDAMLAELLGPAARVESQGTPANPANPANREHWRGSAADSGLCESLRISANPGPQAAGAGADSQEFADVRKASNRPQSKQWRGFSQDSQLSHGSSLRIAGAGCEDEPPAAPAPAQAASPRTCRACSHRLRAGTCAEPVAAGLIGSGFRLAWGTDAHAARCPAFAGKMPAQGRSRPYRLTKAGGDAAHARPWDDDAIGRFLDRVASFRRRGFGEQDAEDLAERAHLLDLDADDRRLCLLCRHLAGSTSTGWRCKNPRAAGLARDLPTDGGRQLS
jgi:hypothetical protein